MLDLVRNIWNHLRYFCYKRIAKKQGSNPAPPHAVFKAVVDLSVKEGKPLYLDYYEESLFGLVFFGETPEKQRMLVKNEEEYTSFIQKVYRILGHFIVITENSIYVVSADIRKRRIIIGDDNDIQDISDEDTGWEKED